jgi:hypothetical protein
MTVKEIKAIPMKIEIQILWFDFIQNILGLFNHRRVWGVGYYF